MKLITRKSECRPRGRSMQVKSPKEAIRRTLSNYLIKDGYIVKAYLPSYVSREEIVLRNVIEYDEIAIKLGSRNSMPAYAS